MSEENVNACRRAVAAFNRGDIEALLAEFDPEVEWRSLAQAMFGREQSVYRGHRGIRQGVADMNEALADLQVEYAEIRDLGDTIVMLGRVHGRGRASGAKFESSLNWLVEFSGGKATRMSDYLDAKEALEAALTRR